MSSVDQRISGVVRRTAHFLASRQIADGTRLLELPDSPDSRPGDLVVVPGAPVGATRLDPPPGPTNRPLARRLEGLTSVARQFSHAAWSGRLDASSRAELRSGARRFLPPSVRREHGALGPQGGLVYRLEAQEEAGWRATCWDAGGILDDNPNTEMTPWPPQAMGMYYADAYAAAGFARLAAQEGDPWRTRALAALDHAQRTYHRYVGAPIWYHHEFKNAPMMEAWVDLGRPGGADWIDHLHGDNYDPNNVMAVRLHWLALRRELRPQRGDAARLARARARLLGCHESSGLFRDDRPPSHRGVRDLSYHLFTLGYLARYLEVCTDEEMAEAFERGAALARELQLADGMIALTGRGTNNVYHQAAAVLAFARASTLRPEYLEAASAALKPIESWQRDDGFLPTALNSHAAERMGWNHCATPYNALSGYLLACARDQLSQPRAGRCAPPPPVDLGDAFARLDGRAALVFAASYPGSTWSGRHGSGVAGTAGLTHADSQLFLALDHLSDLGLQVTDLPRVTVGEVELDWRLPGRVERRDSKTVAYHVATPAGAVTVALTMRDDLVSVELSMPDTGAERAWARVPLLEGCSLGGAPEGARGAHQTPVVSNPRGPGRLITWPLRLDHGRAAYTYRVGPSLIAMVDTGIHAEHEGRRPPQDPSPSSSA